MFTREMATAILLCLIKLTGMSVFGALFWAGLWAVLLRRPTRPRQHGR